MGNQCKINLEWIPAAYQSFALADTQATAKLAAFPLYNRYKGKGTKQSRTFNPGNKIIKSF